MFKEERNYNKFAWEDLGNIAVGRPNLGQFVPVLAYRLFQFTMRDVLITEYGVKTTNDLMYKSGLIAGKQFCKNLLNTTLEFNEFIAHLQKTLKEQNICILRIEKADLENFKITMTVAEDLDCSGLPVSEETVCNYDEGFIAGILKEYTKKDFHVKEVDCWASGDRVCRFEAKLSTNT
ncbi:MAG: 4-vinyl reductase [Planctomycetes bacterium]|nr:4-vinyl reductase [Planctomycetota bacterium]